MFESRRKEFVVNKPNASHFNSRYPHIRTNSASSMIFTPSFCAFYPSPHGDSYETFPMFLGDDRDTTAGVT
jgi:hypothetical protein